MTELIADYVECMAAIGSFEQEWPELSERVGRSLAARGVPPWLRDDIVQETGLRLFKMWDQVDAQRSPRGLALTIAHNILWDERNRKARGEVLGSIPEVAADQDVERSGIARAELERVWQLFPRLNANHRSVLLAEIGGPAPEGSNSDAVKMLRMRARRKLTALLDNATAGIFVAGFELRRLAWRTAATIRRNTIAAELPGSAVAAALCCGVIVALMVPLQLPAPSAEAKEGARLVTPLNAPLKRAVAELTRADRVLAPAGSFGQRWDARHRSQKQPSSGTYVPISVGHDGPAGAEAGIEILPRDDHGLKAPECGPQVSEHEVGASCSIYAPDREVRVGAKVEIRP